MRTLAGAEVIRGGNTGRVSAGLGVALLAYAALSLSAERFSVVPTAERWPAPLVGTATRLVTGMVGVFVIPVVLYLAALGLTKDELV